MPQPPIPLDRTGLECTRRRRSGTVEVGLGLGPDMVGDEAAEFAPHQVSASRTVGATSSGRVRVGREREWEDSESISGQGTLERHWRRPFHQAGPARSK